MDNIPFKSFDKFILRSPFFPYSFFQSLVQNAAISPEQVWQACTRPAVQEAILLASPDLYADWQRWQSGQMQDKKEVARLQLSLLRYLQRMATRPTPFGLFAGFTVGQIGQHTTIELKAADQYSRHTRLDMHYLCALGQDLAKHPHLKEKIRYYPNSSIYRVGNQLRYVEYRYENKMRRHHIMAVDHTAYLERILQNAVNGRYVDELAQLLVEEEISLAEAKEFIFELIDSQVLVNELEPAITGPEFLEQILQVLDTLPEVAEIKSGLHRTAALMQDIDQSPIGTTLALYGKIEEELQGLKTAYEAKFLFQTDMIKPPIHCELDQAVADDILLGLEVLNKMSIPPAETLLGKFREAFWERFETRELPLALVLDVECGLGYRQDEGQGDNSPLLADVVVPSAPNENWKLPWNSRQSLLLRKLLEATENKSLEIELTDDDCHDFKANWDDFPDTIAGLARIVAGQYGEKERPRIFFPGAGGSSAANLLGRFCHADVELLSFVRAIAAEEQQNDPEAIYAEIVHLPESRLGNILLRPIIRQYEIPYLAKAAVAPEFQLRLNDLYLSIKNNRLVLRSRSLNKEIVPRLSTAHNYSYNSLPIYHLLADLQSQNKRNAWFTWGSLQNEFSFMPRVIYKNLIFSFASWKVTKSDLQAVHEEKDDAKLLELVQAWRQAKRIPQYVALEEGDNELVLNLENVTCIHNLLVLTKNKPYFHLLEFLFDPATAVVRSSQGAFLNEFIFAFQRQKKSDQTGMAAKGARPELKAEPQRTFLIGGEWLFFKLYAGPKTADNILAEAIKPLATEFIDKGLVDKWFFIRYGDPQTHIRVRFHLTGPENSGAVIQRLHEVVKPFVAEDVMAKVQADTYQREIERYGPGTMELSETLFFHDSVMQVQALSVLIGDQGENLRWLFALKAIDTFLDDFALTLPQKETLLSSIKESYWREFGQSKELKVLLDNKFRREKKAIQETLTNGQQENEAWRIIAGLLRERSQANQKIVAEIKLVLSGQKEGPSQDELLTSHLHMMVNRLFRTQQRLHELVLYYFLFRHYESALARQKHG